VWCEQHTRYIYMCIYVYIYIYIYIHIYIYILYTYTCMNIHINIHTYIHVSSPLLSTPVGYSFSNIKNEKFSYISVLLNLLPNPNRTHQSIYYSTLLQSWLLDLSLPGGNVPLHPGVVGRAPEPPCGKSKRPNTYIYKGVCYIYIGTYQSVVSHLHITTYT